MGAVHDALLHDAARMVQRLHEWGKASVLACSIMRSLLAQHRGACNVITTSSGVNRNEPQIYIELVGAIPRHQVPHAGSQASLG